MDIAAQGQTVAQRNLQQEGRRLRAERAMDDDRSGGRIAACKPSSRMMAMGRTPTARDLDGCQAVRLTELEAAA